MFGSRCMIIYELINPSILCQYLPIQFTAQPSIKQGNH